MKVELAQEIMKSDFKYDIDILKHNIKEELDKILLKKDNFTNKDFFKFLHEFMVYLNKSNNFREFKSNFT